MKSFSYAEKTDMVLIYGEARCSGTAARRLWMERFPSRRVPCATTFVSIIRCLRENGTFECPKHDIGPQRSGRVLEMEEEVLAIINHEPDISCRKLAKRTGVSTSTALRMLNELGQEQEEENDINTSNARIKCKPRKSGHKRFPNRRKTHPAVDFSEILANVLNELKEIPDVEPFLYPVDPNKVINYCTTISKPMDLETISEKNAEYKYYNRHDFVSDIEQILENSMLFNGYDSSFTRKAEELVDTCKAMLCNYNDNLTKLENKISSFKEQTLHNDKSFLNGDADEGNYMVPETDTSSESSFLENNFLSYGLRPRKRKYEAEDISDCEDDLLFPSYVALDKFEDDQFDEEPTLSNDSCSDPLYLEEEMKIDVVKSEGFNLDAIVKEDLEEEIKIEDEVKCEEPYLDAIVKEDD